MEINVTRKSDGATLSIDPMDIKFVKPRLHECELHFDDGTSYIVTETDVQVFALVKKAMSE